MQVTNRTGHLIYLNVRTGQADDGWWADFGWSYDPDGADWHPLVRVSGHASEWDAQGAVMQAARQLSPVVIEA